MDDTTWHFNSGRVADDKSRVTTVKELRTQFNKKKNEV
jgi:hypothetical protein